MSLEKIKSVIKKKCPFIKQLYWIKSKTFSLPYYLCRVFPIKKNKIVLTSFGGKYGGDPRCISEVLAENEDIDVVWLLKKDANIKNVRCVKYGTFRAIYELTTAKVWVDDCRKDAHVRKRKPQFYIGTGHGGIPMKKIEKDAGNKITYGYLLRAAIDSKMTDLKPSNSQWRNDMLRRAFWYSGEIYNCGLPRVERLIKEKNTMKGYIRKHYSLDDDIKLFLYAPTFREVADMSVYSLDFLGVKKALEDKYGGIWVGLRRLHPNIKIYDEVNIDGVVIDTTDYPDMEDLIMASDLLITDYSSCLFETLFLDIPAFIYATDIESYLEKERGLYWNLYELPFPISTNNEELVDNIRRYDKNLFSEKREKLEKEIGFFEDQTHATELLVERILKEMRLSNR